MTKLERMARDYESTMSFQLEGHRRGFIAGWKACREKLEIKLRDRGNDTKFLYIDNIFQFVSTFGDEEERDYSKVEIDKEAIKAARMNENNFVNMVKNLEPLSVGFRSYEYKGIPIELSNYPEQRAEQLRKQGINAIAITDNTLHDLEMQKWESAGEYLL